MRNTLVTLHVLAAIAGLGPTVGFSVMLAGVAQASDEKKIDTLGQVEKMEKILVTPLTIVILATGLIIVAIDGGKMWTRFWVLASTVLFVGAFALSHAVLTPTGKKMKALLEEQVAGGSPAELGPQIGAAAKKSQMISTTLHLLMVITLVLMIFKPGA